MTQYFYTIGQQQFGPVAKEELQGKITKETLVWCEGMQNWVKAGDVDDLADLFPNIPTPPPMPEQKQSTNNIKTSQSAIHVQNSNNMKSKGIAYLLWLLSIFGWLGFHRFYLGKIGTGILWILTGGVLGIGSLIDLFTLGSKVDLYNTNIELATIRAATLANTMK